MTQETIRRSSFDRRPSGFGDTEEMEVPDIKRAMSQMSEAEEKSRQKKAFDEKTRSELRTIFDRCKC